MPTLLMCFVSDEWAFEKNHSVCKEFLFVIAE